MAGLYHDLDAKNINAKERNDSFSAEQTLIYTGRYFANTVINTVKSTGFVT